MLDRNPFAFSLSCGFLAQHVGQLRTGVAQVSAQDVTLEQKAADAAGMIEQARFAAKAQAIKTGEDERHQRPKTG
jgi:hypothetical protein